MARPLRIEYPGAWYHVMNRGRRKEPIFFEAWDYDLFLKVLKEAHRLFKIEIHAYAFMPNHYHLLIRTPEGNLSRAMRHINGVYTQKINKRMKTDGSLFRGRYKSIVIHAEEYLLELVRYIHQNPLKAGLEDRLGEYKWSSYRGYLNKEAGVDWLYKKEVLKLFSEYENESIRKLKIFMNEEMPPELIKTMESVKWPVFLGGAKFKEKIEKLLKGKEIDGREIPQYKDEVKFRGPRLGNEGLKKLIEMKKDILRAKWSRTLLRQRRALFFIMKDATSKSNKEIRTLLQGISGITDSAIAKQYRMAVEEVDNRKGCYEEVKKFMEELKSLFET